MLFWRWLTAAFWSFIWRWCLSTVWKIFKVLIVMTINVRTTTTIVMKSHTLVVIQNLRTTFDIMDKIQKRKVTWSTRGTVTRLSYRKWRVRARSLSTETAATDNKETPDVVQAVLPWSSLNQQYAVKFLSSSAILDATKSGWHMRPTRRSEAAKEPKRTKDGVWRSRFFLSQEELKSWPQMLRHRKICWGCRLKCLLR